MTTEKTPFADIFRAMSEGKVIEFSTPAVGRWIQLDFASVCEIISKKYVTEDRFRIKPATRTITIEVPEPLRVAPEVGTKVYFFDMVGQIFCANFDPYCENIAAALRLGFLFGTGKDAQAFGDAWIAAMKPKY